MFVDQAQRLVILVLRQACHMRRRIHACHVRRRIRACHMGSRITRYTGFPTGPTPHAISFAIGPAAINNNFPRN
jgi:hypothetical protein